MSRAAYYETAQAPSLKRKSVVIEIDLFICDYTIQCNKY